MAIHPSAVIHPTARVHENVEIGPNVVIEKECEVGEGNVLMAGVVLGPHTRLGKNNRVHYHVVLGGDPQFTGFNPATKSGTVIGDHNEFRECSTVNRAIPEGANTIIGSNCMLMINGHVAHDCVLGDNVVIANGTVLAGHVHIGDRAFISGLVAIHQFTRIGKMAMVGGQSGVTQDVPPFLTAQGGGGLSYLMGVNVVGMRRGGIGPEARLAIKSAFKKIFRSGMTATHGVEEVRAEWAGKEMPGDLAYFLDFCSEKSKRGLLSGRRPAGLEGHDDEDDATDD